MQYRKKPVVIEAERVPLTRDGDDLIRWGHLAGWLGATDEWAVSTEGIEIHTLEGTMLAKPGDWIIRGVKGELYPCKPDIFAATYEPADQTAAVS